LVWSKVKQKHGYINFEPVNLPGFSFSSVYANKQKIEPLFENMIHVLVHPLLEMNHPRVFRKAHVGKLENSLHKTEK